MLKNNIYYCVEFIHSNHRVYFLQMFYFGLHDLFAGVWNFCTIFFCRSLVFLQVFGFVLHDLLQVFGMGEAACHLPKLWRARPNFCTEWKLKVIRRSLSKT